LRPKKYYRTDPFILVILDAVIIFISSFVATNIFLPQTLNNFLTNLPQVWYFIFVTITLFYFFDLYYILKDFRRYRQVLNLLLAVFISVCAIWMLSFFDRSFEVGRKALLLTYVLVFCISAISRLIYSFFQAQFFIRNAVLVGTAPIARALIGELDKDSNQDEIGKKFGLNIIGFISSHRNDTLEKIIPLLGEVSELESILGKNQVTLIIYAPQDRGEARAHELMLKEKLRGIHLVSAVALYEALFGRMPFEHIDSAWLLEDCLRGNKFTEVRLKRLFDIIVGTFLLLVSLPILGIAILLVKVESKGKAIFVQERVGQNGETFKIYKLRTMEDINPKELQVDAEGWHGKNIQRITRFGAFLRKTHIDEMPQFWNVIKGEMSIIGPRPEMDMFIKQCEARIPFYRLRLAIKPGITGWAQVWYGHTSTLKGYKNKFEYDLYYLSHLSLRLDLEIMMRTALIALKMGGR